MHGFNRDPSLRTVHVTVNVSALETMAGDAEKIDLGEYGIDKLLGSGRISKALNISVERASATAISKVEAAGGSVTLSQGGNDEEFEESEEDSESD